LPVTPAHESPLRKQRARGGFPNGSEDNPETLYRAGHHIFRDRIIMTIFSIIQSQLMQKKKPGKKKAPVTPPKNPDNNKDDKPES
jgi:hypothetical protein